MQTEKQIHFVVRNVTLTSAVVRKKHFMSIFYIL